MHMPIALVRSCGHILFAQQAYMYRPINGHTPIGAPDFALAYAPRGAKAGPVMNLQELEQQHYSDRQHNYVFLALKKTSQIIYTIAMWKLNFDSLTKFETILELNINKTIGSIILHLATPPR